LLSFLSVPSARRSSTPEIPVVANDVPKSIELEQRLARIELALKELNERTDRLHTRNIALQAQLDHLAAKLSR
jgi:hypothetical protein